MFERESSLLFVQRDGQAIPAVAGTSLMCATLLNTLALLG